MFCKLKDKSLEELNNKKLIIDNKEVNNNTINMNTPTINKISNISPLRYPGGKTRACKKLDTILKEHFDINKFNSIYYYPNVIRKNFTLNL